MLCRSDDDDDDVDDDDDDDDDDRVMVMMMMVFKSDTLLICFEMNFIYIHRKYNIWSD